MTNVTDISKTTLSVREAAELEVANENRAKGVAKMKLLVRELDKARTIVANYEREIADLEEAIKQGNLPA